MPACRVWLANITLPCQSELCVASKRVQVVFPSWMSRRIQVVANWVPKLLSDAHKSEHRGREND